MPEELGSAKLRLGASLTDLDADLSRAKQRVTAAVGEMQAILDTLDARVDLTAAKLGALGALGGLDRAGAAGPAGPSTATQESIRRNEIWGVRGPQHPGSLQNPLTVVIEAGKFQPMGSQAAAIGQDNVADEQRSGQAQGGEEGSSAASLAALAAAMESLARGGAPGHPGMSTVTPAGREAASAERVPVVLADPESGALLRIADAMERLEKGEGGGHTVLVGGRGGSGGQGGMGRTIIAGTDSRTTTFSGPAGESTVRLDGPQYAGLISAILEGGGGGPAGSAFLNKRVDVFYHASDQGGDTTGGGGLGLLGLLGATGVGPRAGGAGLLGGTGILGMAGIGTAASFAGLGFEHLIFTALGLLGSAGAATVGGGLLGAGALGTAAVGAGSDLGVMKSTVADTQTLSTAITAVSTAQATYGKNSTQAVAATKALDVAMAQLGNTAGVKAEAGLASAGQALDHYFDLQTSAARVQSVNIFTQAVDAGYTFVPLIAQAATRNLTMINSELKPLFAWLTGPQGVQIFQDLENEFAQRLPTAMHAFDQGIEIILRVVDIASQSTGGFIAWLDRLFTRFNSMSTPTLTSWVDKMIADFHLWGNFVKLLGEDIAGLFDKDVGTGNAIITALTRMLEKLHEYESSATGSAQLTNIFMVHKTEILELLHVIGGGIKSFADIYMAIAPPMVTFMNDIALPFLNDVAKVIAAIAGSGHAAALALGGLLVLWKSGQLGALVSGLRGLAGAAGAGAAVGAGAGAAAGGGAAIGAGALTGTVEGAAIGGVGAAGILSGGLMAGLSAALPVVIPAAAAAVGVYLLGHDVLGIGESPRGAYRATSSGTTGGGGGRATGLGTLGISDFNIPKIPLSNSTLDVQEMGKFAGYTADRLKDLIVQMKEAGSLKMNGVSVSKDQFIALALAALKVKDAFNAAFNQSWTAVNKFYRDAGTGMSALKDDFDSNMKLISSTLGLQSDQGKKAAIANIQQMVVALEKSMADGQISVSQGMAEIGTILKTGTQQYGMTWETQWHDMFNSVDYLYAQHKITTHQFLADLAGIQRTADSAMNAEVKANLQQRMSNLQQQLNRGVITQQQYNAQMHGAQVAANTQQQLDMAEWVSTQQEAMKASGALTAQGMQVITKEVNQALGLFGAAKLPIPQAIAWDNYQLTGGTGATGNAGHGTGAASGALMQVGRPGEAGRDSVPMTVGGQDIVVAPGEQVAVLTRHHQAELNARLADEGGLPGFFSTRRKPNYMESGGIVGYSQLEGLWDQAGGPKSLAPLMAAIADAESGGNPSAMNPSGASGLWQILGLPFPGNPFDPATNARMAVAKYLSQGLGAWVTYTSGAYAPYMHGAVPPSAYMGGAGGGAGWSDIKTPKVSGDGALHDIVQGALALVAKDANVFGQNKAGAAGAGSGVSVAAGGAPSGGGFSSSQLGSWGGYTVADWIIPELEYARAHGWTGGITSGYRQGFDPEAPGGSEHALDIYPGGAVDFGGMHSGAALANRDAFLAAVAGYTGERLLTPIGFVDDGHMSGTGHAAGGMLPGFASGVFGLAASKKGTGKNPKVLSGLTGTGTHRRTPKKGVARGGSGLTGSGSHLAPLGVGGPFQFDTSDLSTIDKVLTRILAYDGGDSTGIGTGTTSDATAMSNLITSDTNLWGSSLYPSPNFSSYNSPADFVISTDAAGNSITPYISTNINEVVTQLNEVIGWQQEWVDDLQSAYGLSSQLQAPLQKAISRRVAEIAKIEKRIKQNLAKIRKLQQQIAAARKLISTEQGLRLPYPNPKNAAQRAANQMFDATRTAKISAASSQISQWNQQVAALESENQMLGGGRTSMGTGMEIGALNQELGTPSSNPLGAIGVASGGANTAQGGLYGVQANVDGWLTSLNTPLGSSGGIGAAQMQLQEYQQALSQLLPGATTALTAAGAATTISQDSTLISLLEQQLAQAAQTDLVLTKQYAVLSELPPFAGTFHGGGVIPGPAGAERIALVRAGETVSTAGSGQAMTVHVVVQDGAVDPNKIAVIANGAAQQVMRTASRNASRKLPSRGGGQLTTLQHGSNMP